MNTVKALKISLSLVIILIAVLFGYFHLDFIKATGIALLVFVSLLLEPLSGVLFDMSASRMPKKVIPWSLTFLYAFGVLAVAGFAAWLLY